LGLTSSFQGYDIIRARRWDMSNEPIKANNIEVEIFTSQQYSDDLDAFQLAINAWLKSQPSNALVQDILYRHSGRTPRGKDIVSVVIISSLATAK